MSRIALLLFVAVTLNVSAEQLSLDQAIAAALEHNASVRNARLEVEKAQTRIAAARTHRLPSFEMSMIGGEMLSNLSIEIEETGERIDLGRSFNTIGIARISQPVTQFHSINLGIKLHEAAMAADKEREREARLAVAREVKSAYFAVLSARGYAEAMQESVTAWEEVEREMNVRVSQKAALEADRLDASARLASTRLAALSANNTLATAKDQLNYLVGRPIDVVDDVGRASARLPEAVAPNRPDIREAELRVEQAKLDWKRKRAERIPDIALTLTSATPFGNDRLPANMTSAGITMSYEPFTWGRREAELREKRHAVEQAENALRDKKSAADVEIAARLRKVEESAAQIAVRRLESEAARERLRVTKTRFQQQAARLDEMFHANATLSQTAAREQEAISAYWIARADYEKAIGQE
ncbi:MAG TPA: TolC family protein [Thermoanaerobaculia bacterium]